MSKIDLVLSYNRSWEGYMAEKITITCLINNEVLFGPPVWGEYGLSWLIETSQNQLIFDTGASVEVLEHNLRVLKKNLKKLSHVVLSHGHHDHTGGLSHLLNRGHGLYLIAAPQVFESKYSIQKNKPPHSIGISLSEEAVRERAEIIFQDKPMEILPGIMVSGRIPRTADFEMPESHFLCRRNGELQIDPFDDDRALVIQTTEGLIVMLGCAHSGLINTLREARRLFDLPILMILGGSHLAPVSENRLKCTIEALRNEFPEIKTYRLNHCTENKAQFALYAAFGERVNPFLAGEKMTFEIRG